MKIKCPKQECTEADRALEDREALQLVEDEVKDDHEDVVELDLEEEDEEEDRVEHKLKVYLKK